MINEFPGLAIGFNEKESGATVIERVPNKTALLSGHIIVDFCHKGTNFVSDEGGAFKKITDLTDEKGETMEYSHITCCHAGMTGPAGLLSVFVELICIHGTC